jgi:hypothetical protein
MNGDANSFKKSDTLRLVFIWIKHFSLIKKHFACWHCRHFVFIFRVLKLNCSFPKIYHEKVTLSYESFSIFVCLFVLFFCLFFLFFFRLVCLSLFYFFVKNITFCIGYKQNWSMRRRIAVMKNHGGDIYFTLF